MRKIILPLLGVLAAGIVGCDTSTPNSAGQRTAARDEAHVSLERMEAQDSGLSSRVQNAYGYAVFPEIGAAAVGIGGASGEGTVYRNGQPVGRVTLKQASLGFQIGGDTFGELILFQDEAAFNRFTNDNITFGADANATIIKAGAAGSANFANGVQVNILPKGGLMAGINVNGQKFHYTASSDQNMQH